MLWKNCSTPAAPPYLNCIFPRSLQIWTEKFRANCTVAPKSLPQFGDSSRISLKSGCPCFPSIFVGADLAHPAESRLAFSDFLARPRVRHGQVNRPGAGRRKSPSVSMRSGTAQHVDRIHVAIFDAAEEESLQGSSPAYPALDRRLLFGIEDQTGCPSSNLSNSTIRSRMRPSAINSWGVRPVNASSGEESHSFSLGATT